MRSAALLLIAVVACSSYGAAPEASADAGATTDGGDVPASDAGEAGTDGGGCVGSPGCERIVFVSSTTSTGDLGGLDGADKLCQTLADASARTRGRTFRAWLSTSGTSAGGRISHATKPYKRPDGAVVAASFDELVKGLEAPINVDENGAVVPTGEVWTGTSDIGVATGSNCVGWTSDGGATSGRQGSAGRTDAPWSDNQIDAPCYTSARVYCFEN